VKKCNQEQKRPKILVIDDNFLFLETLLELLDTNGFQSIGAQQGSSGMQLAEAQMPNVIICDISLPDFNGFEVLRQLRQNPATAKIPLIFITADPTNNAQYLIEELGANGYLSKPFSIDQLIEAIQTQI
jgi:CheY-like chemotaxis protein